MVQAVESLPCESEALSPNSSHTKKKFKINCGTLKEFHANGKLCQV
jgi:hypothetical protein